MCSETASSGLVFDIDVTARRGDTELSARIAVPGSVVALSGRSGAGKTSLLDMVAGLLHPRSGRVMVGGEVLFDSVSGVNMLPERRACGYVFQDNRLFPHISVRDNLLYGAGRAVPLLTLAEVCEFLGIGGLLSRMPTTLSGGEAQRVAIGRALLSGPRFLLLDEPLASLDRPRREGILRVIERIRDELSLPMIYVSHDRAEIDRLADSVVEID